jgi:hypothetical protein
MGSDGQRTALNTEWSERYLGGTPEKESEILRLFADQIQGVQKRNRDHGDGRILRAFHAKLVAGVANARFTVRDDVRPELRVGLFVPGATYPAMVRFSNASGVVRNDAERDLRGIALRVVLDELRVQDFILSNTRTAHARDARQFMVAAMAMAGGRRIGALPGLVRGLGLREAARVFRTLERAASHRVQSLATETFFSRVPFALGPYAVKFVLRPTAPDAVRTPRTLGRDSLREEFVGRLRGEDVRYELRLLHYVDEATTPIEDATVEWPEGPAPADTVADLLIPKQDLTAGEGPDGERSIEALEFSPWKTEGIRPLGGLNRARKPVYEASARLRSGGEGR